MFISSELANGGADVIREFVKSEAGKRFGWKNSKADEYGYFISDYAERLSDSAEQIRQAIQKHVHSDDVVLSTPKHVPFFKEHGVTRITTYDVSPQQLYVERATADKIFWCDLLHQRTVQKLITKCRPTVLYMSNIHEQARSRYLDWLVDLFAKNNVRMVMYSRVIDRGRFSDPFKTSFYSRKWDVREYLSQSDDYRTIGDIYVAIRK